MQHSHKNVRFTSLRAIAISALLFGGLNAFAGQYNCSEKIRDGRKLDVEVAFSAGGSGKAPVYKSRINIDGTGVPQLGAACFYSDRPGTRYIKCSHQSGNLRIEIYPLVETTSGALKVMQFIIWNGSRATKGNLASCRQS